MVDNKRQHYVPKFHLRRFASDPDSGSKARRIDLVNIARAKVVRGASLREQCYRDYFYGKSTNVEKALGQAEGYFSFLTGEMIDTRSIDERQGWHFVQMIMLQRSRTLRAEEEINGMIEKFVKLAMHGRVGEDVLRRAKISLKDAAHHNVAHALLLSPMILDLKRFLVVNETSVPFVLADNPVVTTNWFGRARHLGRSAGLARSGLQMFLPLSPGSALLLHDANVYSADAPNGVIIVRRADEIAALNELQWLNAYRNVYISPGLNNACLAAMMATARPDSGLFDFSRFERAEADGSYRASGKDEFSAPSKGVKTELVVTSARILPQDIRLRAVRLRHKPIVHDDGSLESPQRDPAWRSIVEGFARQAAKGATSLGQFWDFVAEHPLERSIGPWIRRALRRQSSRVLREEGVGNHPPRRKSS